MIELTGRAHRRPLASLFPKPQDALLLSGLQGHMGRAFVSREGQSGILAVRGFIFLGGRADVALLREAAPFFEGGFLTFSGPEPWLEAARAWGATLEMTRFAMETPPAFDVPALRALAKAPQGFVLSPVDDRLFGLCLEESWSADLVAAFPDTRTLAQRGLAVVALRDGRPVAGCGAYAYADGQLEVEIDTHPQFRRQGLATACGAAFLLGCLERGLSPHWDAMTPVSRSLAQKLGFGSARPYPVVCKEGE